MYPEKVRNFIVKLQGLSDAQKKAILLGIIIVFGLILGTWWIYSSARIISTIDNVTFVSLPPIQGPAVEALDSLKNLGSKAQDQLEDIPVQLAEPQELSLDADGWQVYAKSEYGFEVTYPQSYLLKEQANRENYLFYVNFYKTEAVEPAGLPTPYVSVSVYDQPVSLETWLKENGIEKWERNNDFFVDGQKAVYLTNPGKLGVATLVVVSHGDKLFSLANFDSSSFKKFVSSFKFTN